MKNTVNRKTIKLIGFIALILIFLICLYRYYYNQVNYDTDILQNEDIEKIKSYTAVVTRTENVYLSPDYGQVVLYRQEGDKIPKGVKILSIIKSDQSTELDEKLRDINKEINEYYQRNTMDKIIKADLEKIEQNILSVQRDIQTAVKQQDIEVLEQKNSQLEELFNKRLDIIAKSSENEYLQALYDQKNELMQQKQELIQNVYSNQAGVISYNIDGYENILTPDVVQDYRWQDIRHVIDKVQTTYSENRQITANVGQPLYKIMDNFKCFLTIPIDKQDVDLLSGNSSVKIKVDGQEQFLNANILNINNSDEKFILNLEFDYDIPVLWRSRLVNIDIKLQDLKGYKVLPQAIVNKNGQTGIYILKRNLPEFVAVQVLAKGENYVIIKDDNDDLNLFDEYIINTGRIKDVK